MNLNVFCCLLCHCRTPWSQRIGGDGPARHLTRAVIEAAIRTLPCDHANFGWLKDRTAAARTGRLLVTKWSIPRADPMHNYHPDHGRPYVLTNGFTYHKSDGSLLEPPFSEA